MSAIVDTKSKLKEHNKFYKEEQQAPASSTDQNPKELKRIGDALNNVELHKLFQEYCKQQIDNNNSFEEEIKQFEAKHDLDIVCLNPKPGFVLQTSTIEDDALQCFINVAKSELVLQPTSEGCVDIATGKRCLNWSLPLAQTTPYDDHDELGQQFRVYDVIFHPDALYLAQRNTDFRQNLINTALDSVEDEHNVKFDRDHLKFPKLQFKGIPRPTVIPKLPLNITAIIPDEQPPNEIEKAMHLAVCTTDLMAERTSDGDSEFITPKYTMKYHRESDLNEYTNQLDANELIVEIELPLLKSVADFKLNVLSQTLCLLSKRAGAKYRLKLDLPHIVDDKSGSARFDYDTKRLCITLPVVQQEQQQHRIRTSMLQLNREDSGVESDIREESNSNNSDAHSSVDEEEKDEENLNNALSETMNSAESSSFLNNDINYQFPAKLDCNVLDNTISFVLHVRNVKPESLVTTHQAKDMHLKFVAMGVGSISNYYAFYLQLPALMYNEIISIEAEAWENNVVLNLNMCRNSEQFDHYLAGCDKSNLKEYAVLKNNQVLRTSRQRNKLLTESQKSVAAKKLIDSVLDIVIERTECKRAIEIEIKARNSQASVCAAGNTDEDEDEEATIDDSQQTLKKSNKKQKRKNKKRRSLSESACDDIKAYEEIQEQQQREERNALAAATENDNAKQQQHTTTTAAVAVPLSPKHNSAKQQQRKQRSYSECRDSANSSAGNSFKGILKHYSRYNSASSIDESLPSSYSCSVDAAVSHSMTGGCSFSQSFSDIPEEQHDENAGLSESCKKTVRFNEVIKKQVFRNHSSILGQRKKNQKRRDRKQRAIQRRLSEGDSADYEEDKLVDLPTEAQYFKNKNKTKDVKNAASSCLRKHQTQHDSGLDLTGDKITNEFKTVTKLTKIRSRLESESSSDLEVHKNGLMFEMDM